MYLIGVQIDILLERLPILSIPDQKLFIPGLALGQRLFFVISLQLSLFSSYKGSHSDLYLALYINKKNDMYVLVLFHFTRICHFKNKLKKENEHGTSQYHVILFLWHKKQVNISRKCHNQRPQTNS